MSLPRPPYLPSFVGPRARQAAPKAADAIPPGSVLPLLELMSDGSTGTVGTLVVISREGLAVTASHCVLWDGRVYPDALRVSSEASDDRRLRHIATSPLLDLTAFQLYRTPGGSSSGGSGGGIGGGGIGGDGSEGGRRGTWPHVSLSAAGLTGGELHGFCLDQYPVMACRSQTIIGPAMLRPATSCVGGRRSGRARRSSAH